MDICKHPLCITKNCFCNLPMLAYDHIELNCCKHAVYHVKCIIKCEKCPHCFHRFNDNTMEVIQMTQNKVLKKLKKKAMIEKKKSLFREEIKKTVRYIILYRMKQKIKSNQSC